MKAVLGPFFSKERVMTPLRQRMIEDMKLRNSPRRSQSISARVAAFDSTKGRKDRT